MANMQRLEALLGELKADPSKHNNDYYYRETPCGTTHCVAGLAVERYFTEDTGQSFSWRMEQFSNEAFATLFWAGDDELMDTWEVGRGLLGLTSDQANQLFPMRRTLEDIELTIKQIANGEL